MYKIYNGVIISALKEFISCRGAQKIQLVTQVNGTGNPALWQLETPTRSSA